jgi:hypothetical protein
LRSRLKKNKEQGAAVRIRSFMQPGAFDPEAIAAMSEAFEATLKDLPGVPPDIVREVIAGRIIAVAKLGERDPVRLREAALARVLGERG